MRRLVCALIVHNSRRQVYWRHIGTFREFLRLQFWAWCIQIHTSENQSLQAETLQYPFIQAQKLSCLHTYKIKTLPNHTLKLEREREREREREMCCFWISSFFFTLCKKFWSTRCPWVTVLHYKRHLRRYGASESVLVFGRKNESVAIYR